MSKSVLNIKYDFFLFFCNVWAHKMTYNEGYNK